MRSRIAFTAVLTVCLSGGHLAGSFKTEYFTEVELDLIRDAQELKYRVPTYIKIAERRLVTLGLVTEKKPEKEKARKQKNEEGEVIDDSKEYAEFSKADLLRGYAQAIEEIMSNIDDAYDRRQEVREPLEDFLKFIETTLPLLDKYEAGGAVEKTALTSARSKAEEGQDGAREALKKVPKTEKKRK